MRMSVKPTWPRQGEVVVLYVPWAYGAVMVSESMVIAVWASNLPLTVEFAPTVTAVPVNTIPLNVDDAPMVSAVSNCQKTFLGRAPPVKTTRLPAPVVTVPVICKIHTSLGPPFRVTFEPAVKLTLVVHLYKPASS